jgi:hypothetical protein
MSHSSYLVDFSRLPRVSLGHGSYNEAYHFPDLDCVVKTSLPQDDARASAISSPNRTVRVSQEYSPELNAKIIPDFLGKPAWSLDYVAGSPSSDLVMALLVLTRFEKTGRVLIDATASNNVLTKKSGVAACVDTDLAFKRRGSDAGDAFMGGDSEGSILDRQNFRLSRLQWFHVPHSLGSRLTTDFELYPASVTLLKTLINEVLCGGDLTADLTPVETQNVINEGIIRVFQSDAFRISLPLELDLAFQLIGHFQEDKMNPEHPSFLKSVRTLLAKCVQEKLEYLLFKGDNQVWTEIRQFIAIAKKNNVLREVVRLAALSPMYVGRGASEASQFKFVMLAFESLGFRLGSAPIRPSEAEAIKTAFLHKCLEKDFYRKNHTHFYNISIYRVILVYLGRSELIPCDLDLESQALKTLLSKLMRTDLSPKEREKETLRLPYCLSQDFFEVILSFLDEKFLEISLAAGSDRKDKLDKWEQFENLFKEVILESMFLTQTMHLKLNEWFLEKRRALAPSLSDSSEVSAACRGRGAFVLRGHNRSDDFTTPHTFDSTPLARLSVRSSFNSVGSDYLTSRSSSGSENENPYGGDSPYFEAMYAVSCGI